MLKERVGEVSMGGKPIILLGPKLKPGDLAPDFDLLDNNLKTVKLSDTAGKIRLLSVVPSLDTEVCALQTETFSREARRLSADVVFYTISMDLPFAQKRWLKESEIDNVMALSDFNKADFGTNYGLLLKELRLLARAVLVVDRKDRIAYLEIVSEITNEPDYAAALEAIRNLR